MAAVSTTPVSPKVKAGANWAAYATLLLTLLTSITPDMLDFMGAYAPLGYGLVVGLSYAVGAYLKRDALRDVGAEVLAAEAPAAEDLDVTDGPRHRAE